MENPRLLTPSSIRAIQALALRAPQVSQSQHLQAAFESMALCSFVFTPIRYGVFSLVHGFEAQICNCSIKVKPLRGLTAKAS